MHSVHTVAQMAYDELLSKGIAREVARLVLPQSSYTRIYVTGSARSWMHYLGVRDEEGVVQYEHVELARAIRAIFAEQFPTVNKAFFNSEPPPLEKENLELRAEIATLKSSIKNNL